MTMGFEDEVERRVSKGNGEAGIEATEPEAILREFQESMFAACS